MRKKPNQPRSSARGATRDEPNQPRSSARGTMRNEPNQPRSSARGAMRKSPKQQRSREMVDRLLDATAACLATQGLDATTTNHIADEADVSIGSLYQYFADKDALVDALLDRMGAEIRAGFDRRAEIVALDQLPLRTVAELGITYGLHRMRTDPLVREIVRNWNRLSIEKILGPLEGYFLLRAQPYFLQNYRDYPIQHLEAKLYVLISSTLLATIRYLSDEHRLIPEERFVATLADMIIALLEYPDQRSA